MSFQIFITLAIAAAAAVAQSPALTVNTPLSVQACRPIQLTWSGGSPPYYVSLLPAGQPSDPIIKDFGMQNSNSLTWQVDQPAGTLISVQIRDASGAVNYSNKVTIQSSTSCPDGSSSSSGNSTAASTPKSGTPSSPSSSTPATSSGKPAASNSGSTTPSSTPTTSSPSGPAAPASPASTGASSDASRNIPGLLALGLAAAVAVFA